MKTYPIELRQRIIDAVDQQLSAYDESAEIFGISERYIYKLLRQRRETGSLALLPRGGGAMVKLDEEQLLMLAELVARQPGATPEELRQRLRRETKVEASVSTVWRSLEMIEFTQKKTKLAQETDPVESAAFRKRQRRLNVWRLIFIDEFGIDRAMSRIYGRAPRGERARVKEPTERRTNISVRIPVIVNAHSG